MEKRELPIAGNDDSSKGLLMVQLGWLHVMSWQPGNVILVLDGVGTRVSLDIFTQDILGTIVWQYISGTISANTTKQGRYIQGCVGYCFCTTVLFWSKFGCTTSIWVLTLDYSTNSIGEHHNSHHLRLSLVVKFVSSTVMSSNVLPHIDSTSAISPSEYCKAGQCQLVTMSKHDICSPLLNG